MKIAKPAGLTGALSVLFPVRAIWLAAALTLVSVVADAQTAVSPPVVSHVPEVGAMWNRAPVDLGRYGLYEAEYFIEGTTTSGAYPYKSRMIVRAPGNPRRFNGTVIIEWMNASSGLDVDVDFLSLLPLIAREGYAYVAVTAQTQPAVFLQSWSPERYGTLNIPAGGFNDVFSQAGQALRDNGLGVDPLNGLKVKKLIAIGQSQSAFRLTGYINSVHGLTLEPVFDAYVTHAGVGNTQRFPVPVFVINSENEAPGYFGLRDTADDNYRYWEVAGTSHQPLAGTAYVNSLLEVGRGSAVNCPFPFSGVGGPVPIDPVLRAAVHHLNNWINGGEKPPEAPFIAMVPEPNNPLRGTIERDEFGNAKGGIRMPQQEVPTGRNSPSFGCTFAVPFPPYVATTNLFPQFDAFDGNMDPGDDPTDVYEEPSSARALYRSRGDYLFRYIWVTHAAYQDGFLLRFDAWNMIRAAAKSNPWSAD